MPETATEKRVKYHVMMCPSLRRRLRQAAAMHDVSISAMLHMFVEEWPQEQCDSAEADQARCMIYIMRFVM